MYCVRLLFVSICCTVYMSCVFILIQVAYVHNLYKHIHMYTLTLCIGADLSYPTLYPSSTLQHPPNGRPSRPVSGVGPNGQNYDRPSSVSKGSSFPTNGSYLAGSEIIHISLEDEEGKV